jgi:hypothetical protein
MEEIVEAAAQVKASRQRLHDAVTAARSQGHTWQQIGDALDMSRQAAFKRFGRPINPSNGDALVSQPVRPILDLAERAFSLVATADYDTLHELMTPDTAKTLTADLIADTWASVLSEVGELETCRGTEVELPDGTVLDPDERVQGVKIAATTLQCEAGSVLGRIAFDGNGKIIGMLIVPTDHGDLPF